MYLYVAEWQCDPVICYSGAFAGVCRVELIKPSEAPGLCRAPAHPPVSPSPGVNFDNFGYRRTDEKEQGHFVGCQKEKTYKHWLNATLNSWVKPLVGKIHLDIFYSEIWIYLNKQ